MTRRSTRETRIPDRLTYAQQIRLKGESFEDIYCQVASSDPDTMYLHEARKEPDWPKFKQSMQKEIDGQINNKNFRIRKRTNVPPKTQVLPGVWILKRKRKITTQDIYKWKARLNLDGSRQVKGIHYDKTYTPVAAWSTVRLILILILAWG